MELVVQELLISKEFVEFLVGRDGEFDQLISSVVRKSKRTIRNDNSALVLILPYSTAEYRNNEQSFIEYYDEIELCSEDKRQYYQFSRGTSLIVIRFFKEG